MKYDKLDKIGLFKEAKHTSNALLIWNLPTRKKLIGEELAKEAEEMLKNYNEIDGLIIKHFGNGGWHTKESEVKAFYDNNEPAGQELIIAVSKQYAFINLLEAKAGRIGELDEILKKSK